ncbi:MAG: ArsR/SmtB family transcription factor [Halobacteriales archaeon]
MAGNDRRSPSDVFSLLGDDYAREILVTAEEPTTAKDLSDATDASLTTVYRRLSALKEHGLVEERSTVDPDASHKREFVTAVEGIHAELSDGSFSLTVEKRDELADNFTSLWSDIRESG